jgi:hypothetical protein
MKDIPRPWLLAALTDVSINELARLDAQEPPEDVPERSLPRADERRPRLAAWRGRGYRYPGDAWWQPGLEAERPH